MKFGFILLLIIVPFMANGQISFNAEIGQRSEKAKVAIRPYYHNLMYQNYRDIEVRSPPSRADKFSYEWAVEHKTLPLELWLHIEPGAFALTNARVNALAGNLTADLVTDVMEFSDQLMQRGRCTTGHWARVSGIDPVFSDKSAGIIMSSYKSECGLMEYYLIFDGSQYDKLKDEIFTMMLAFCFRPDPRVDESAGVGVKVSYDTNDDMFFFQEVAKGAGAWDAGFLPGDQILTIDGKEEIYLEDIYSVTGMLKGAEGTETEVGVLRDGLQYDSKIIRRKYLPEQVTFLTAASREILLEKIKRFSEFILYSDDILTFAGAEAGKDVLGNQKWEYQIKFPGGYPGFLTHNNYLLDRYEISYRLTNEKNSEKSEKLYDYLKSILTEAMGSDYKIEESTEADGLVRLGITDPDDIISGNSVMLTLDKSNYDKSVVIEYIYPQ